MKRKAPEPITKFQKRECSICLEESKDPKEWICFDTKNQLQLHVPCMVEILVRNIKPKNPYTGQEFSSYEIKLIEKKAKICNIVCPKEKDRKWKIESEQNLDFLHEFAKHCGVNDCEKLFENMKTEIQDYIFSWTNMKNGIDRKSAEQILAENFKEFEKMILQKVHERLQQPAEPQHLQMTFILSGSEAFIQSRRELILQLIDDIITE